MNFCAKKVIGFTLVEIMIVVLIIGILLAIAAPNFINARESSRAKACVGNLKQIDSATQQYCMDKKVDAANYTANLPTLNTNAATGLVGVNAYLRQIPSCPSGGTEAVATAITAPPSCSIPATNSADTNYLLNGRYYHGM